MITFEAYFEQFQNDVRNAAHGDVEDPDTEGRQPDYKENAFTQLMLDSLAEQDIADGTVVCHFAAKTTKGNIKLNAWGINEEEGIVTLCISNYRANMEPVNLTNKDIDQAVSQAVRAFELAVDGYHLKMEQASESYKMMKQIYDLRAEIALVEVILLTDSLLPAETKIQRERKGPYSFRYDFYDTRRVFRFIESSLPYETVQIDLKERFGSAIPCLPSQNKANDYDVFLAVFPGSLLSELYDEFGSHLLDLNVRSFLQIKGKVNKGIRETLCKEPLNFLAYNNGISATAESVIVNNSSNHGIPEILSITGFQVVNGGQTMASIHRAHKIDKADISNVFVQTKITVVPAEKVETLAPFISKYANSQNRVNDADFSSNDPFNIELQHLSEKIWTPGEASLWFYERTRGSYHVKKYHEAPTAARAKQFDIKYPTSQRFTKTDMAKYLNCWDRKPHIVSLGAQKNFVKFMDSLRSNYPKDWKPDEKYYKDLISKAIIFKAADKAARNQNIQAYKANVVAYMVSLLSEKCLDRLDLSAIWTHQAAPSYVIDVFTEWAITIYDVLISSAGQRNVTEWCKKEDCWQAVRLAAIDIPDKLRRELEKNQPLPTVGGFRYQRKNSLDREDQDNISKTMQVDSETWFKISEWGKKKRKLEAWQSNIAFTLAGYAQDNWRKVPSIKQARQAVIIINKYNEQKKSE